MELPQPGAPTCSSGGPARPAQRRHSHIRGHTICISKFSTEHGGPEKPRGPKSRPVRCPNYYTRVITPSLSEKQPGLSRQLGRVSEEPGSRACLPPPLKQQWRKLSSLDRPQQLLWLRPWKCISGTGGAICAQTPAPLHPAFPDPFRPFPPKSTAQCGRGRVSRGAK